MKFLIFLFLTLPALTFTSPPRHLDHPIPNQFTLVASANIRQCKPYRVIVRGFNLLSSMRIKITLGGVTDAGDSVNIRRTARISPTNPKDIEIIDTCSFEPGSYWLNVEGGNISENRTLYYISKKYTFSMQLNKAIHRPNELVRFRIYATDSETNAVNPIEPSIVSILNPKNVLVTSHQNVSFTLGKYENQFQLSDKTRLGVWIIRFECAGEYVEKSFEVAEYQLPLITGKLIVENLNPFSAGSVPMTIDISYTSGGRPTGTAILTVKRYGNTIEPVKEVEINSKDPVVAEFTMEQLGVTTTATYDYLEVFLSFHDPLTNLEVKDHKYFMIVMKQYSIYASGPQFITPGTNYPVTVYIRKTDGTPAEVGKQFTIEVVNPMVVAGQVLYLGDNGQLTTDIPIPDDAEYLQLRITSHDSDDGYHYAGKKYDQGLEGYLNIEILDRPVFNFYSVDSIKLYQPVNVELSTDHGSAFAIVHIAAKGVLLKSLTVWFVNTNDGRKATFSFTPTIDYAPQAEIFAYLITRQGNLLIGQRYIQFTYDLPNYLNIRPETVDPRPGTKVRFDIESHVGTRVSLAAIDQRTLLVRDGERFTEQNVFEDMYVYSYASGIFWRGPRSRPIRPPRRRFTIIIISNINQNNGDLRPRESEERRAPADRSANPNPETEPTQLREDFSETFLWQDVDIEHPIQDDLGFTDNESPYGLESITAKVPESITKYLIFGVAMSCTYGMGLSNHVTSVNIFLPFFINVELPYSVKEGEALMQDIFISNFLGNDQTVFVKIQKDSRFEAFSPDEYGWSETDDSYTQTIETQAGQVTKVIFFLTALRRGLIPFVVTANGPVAGDGIRKYLRVVPRGYPRTITRSLLVAVEDSGTVIRDKLKCNLPISAYQDTTEISTSITGDVLGKAINNLDRFIIFPSGCCEQISSKLIANIIIYNYLSASNQLTPELKAKLEANIAAGIQNLLNCLQANGGFAVFSRGQTSIWVTAYIIQHLNSVSDSVNVDENLITRAADFIKDQQKADGSFVETGAIVHEYIQGGGGRGTALTAFVSIALSNLVKKYPQYATARKNSIKYLEGKYLDVESAYELGIITYALQLGGSRKAKDAFTKFKDMRKETSTSISWIAFESDTSSIVRSLNQEVTAYGLLNYIRRGESVTSMVKIAKYLTSHTNHLGGSVSSHDTSIALSALGQFARSYTLGSRVVLKLTPDVGDSINAIISRRNALTLKTYELDPAARELGVRASSPSSGLAVVSLICNFYENENLVVPQFDITHSFARYCNNFFEMKACVRHLRDGPSNMALIVVTMPSGFSGYSYNNPAASLVEITNEGTEITFYYDSIGNTETCVSIYAWRSRIVNNLMAGFIQVYDYYDTSKQGREAFQAPDLTQDCI